MQQLGTDRQGLWRAGAPGELVPLCGFLAVFFFFVCIPLGIVFMHCPFNHLPEAGPLKRRTPVHQSSLFAPDPNGSICGGGGILYVSMTEKMKSAPALKLGTLCSRWSFVSICHDQTSASPGQLICLKHATGPSASIHGREGSAPPVCCSRHWLPAFCRGDYLEKRRLR